MYLSDKFMRVFVLFDLPTNTKKERAAASQFRNSLLKRGFYMLQFSVYVKLCSGYESAKLLENNIANFVPKSGAVRTMLITEKQYASMRIMLGPKLYQESMFDSDDSLVFF